MRGRGGLESELELVWACWCSLRRFRMNGMHIGDLSSMNCVAMVLFCYERRGDFL